jgi:hypothetical protein
LCAAAVFVKAAVAVWSWSPLCAAAIFVEVAVVLVLRRVAFVPPRRQVLDPGVLLFMVEVIPCQTAPPATAESPPSACDQLSLIVLKKISCFWCWKNCSYLSLIVTISGTSLFCPGLVVD